MRGSCAKILRRQHWHLARELGESSTLSPLPPLGTARGGVTAVVVLFGLVVVVRFFLLVRRFRFAGAGARLVGLVGLDSRLATGILVVVCARGAQDGSLVELLTVNSPLVRHHGGAARRGKLNRPSVNR